jgi:hypothetical protein
VIFPSDANLTECVHILRVKFSCDCTTHCIVCSVLSYSDIVKVASFGMSWDSDMA